MSDLIYDIGNMLDELGMTTAPFNGKSFWMIRSLAIILHVSY